MTRTSEATYFNAPDAQVIFGPLLTPKQAAEYLSVAVQTLAHRRCQGLPPRFVRISGRKVGYLRSDLDELIKAGLRSSTSESVMAA